MGQITDAPKSMANSQWLQWAKDFSIKWRILAHGLQSTYDRAPRLLVIFFLSSSLSVQGVLEFSLFPLWFYSTRRHEGRHLCVPAAISQISHLGCLKPSPRSFCCLVPPSRTDCSVVDKLRNIVFIPPLETHSLGKKGKFIWVQLVLLTTDSCMIMGPSLNWIHITES